MARRYKVWHEGEIRLSSNAHPYPAEKETSAAMKRLFVGWDKAICWWCGRRQEWWGLSHVNVDHVAPLVYKSPRAVMCKECNYVRRGVLPNAPQMRRLLYSRQVVLDRTPAQLKRWLQVTAEEAFGGFEGGVGLLVAKCGGWAVRTRRDGPVCARSTEICSKVGFDGGKV